MSKRESISRYNLIINLLRKRPATYEEISQMLEKESELQDLNLLISQRTFQRDCLEISSLYDIEIAYDRAIKAYRIMFDDHPEIGERILESFDIFNALHNNDKLNKFIHLENRKPKGTENLYGIIHALKNGLKLSFTYEKYDEPGALKRVVDPYVLKEFRNRWYLIGNDCKKNQIRTYGLDRLTNLEVQKQKFTSKASFDHETYFKNFFGIIYNNDNKPEQIVLSFDKQTGNYIKSMPLHHSQKELEDSEHEYRIQLEVCVTYDLILEILSYGEHVKVIQPKSLANEIKTSLIKALSNYNDVN